MRHHTETIGPAKGPTYRPDPGTPLQLDRQGNLSGWRVTVASHCAMNSRLTFFTSLAFVGPLLARLPGVECGGFHLVGDSSCGKTTALRVAASVWGGHDYLQRWPAPDKGLVRLAVQHSGRLLCLDELAQLDASVAGESAAMLASGQGKSLAGRTGGAMLRQSWRLLFASAGEIGLERFTGRRGPRAIRDIRARLSDLPADAGAGLGIFDNLGDFESAGALALHLTQATGDHHGTAGAAWIEWLSDGPEGVVRTLRERVERETYRLVPFGMGGWAMRAGRRFAAVAVAGELATLAGVTGWPEGTASEAARRCFGDWLQQIEGAQQ